MIQRKQTIFLFIAFILAVACLALPIATLEPQKMGGEQLLYNLCVLTDKGKFDFSQIVAFPLFIMMVIVAAISLITIFLFRNRKLQMRLCSVSMILIVLWYAYFAACKFALTPETLIFHPAIACVFPICTMIFIILARNGVRADERLVRAADRIR